MYNGRPIESRIWSIERRRFQWPWTTPNQISRSRHYLTLNISKMVRLPGTDLLLGGPPGPRTALGPTLARITSYGGGRGTHVHSRSGASAQIWDWDGHDGVRSGEGRASSEPARGLGEPCELPLRGLGRSPRRNWIWCILALKYCIWL